MNQNQTQSPKRPRPKRKNRGATVAAVLCFVAAIAIVGTYTFKEVTAPKGYSVNTNDTPTVELKVEGNGGVASGVISKGTEITDTKLSALPSTGGMGTYLFTIIGVVVMAGAAGAFFISRRKGSEE